MKLSDPVSFRPLYPLFKGLALIVALAAWACIPLLWWKTFDHTDLSHGGGDIVVFFNLPATAILFSIGYLPIYLILGKKKRAQQTLTSQPLQPPQI